MASPEKISEAITQTQTTIKTFRKSMLLLLFEWQNLETRLEQTQKCLNESFPVQESASKPPTELGDFGLVQENGILEMGVLKKEVDLREKRVREQEGLIEMERKLIGEKLREIEVREEEFRERVKGVELREKELERVRKDLEVREEEWNMKEKVNQKRGSAVFRIAGPSNQSMALVNASETSPGNQQISKGRLRSKAWLHFTKIAKGVGSNDKCKCNYCHRIFTLCGGSTSQLLRHISEGRCSAYQNRNSALQIDEILGEPHSRQSVDVRIEEAVTRPSNGCEEGVKQEPATALLESELQTQPRMEPPMAIPNDTGTCEYDYQPRQLKELSKNQSDPALDQPPPGMENSGISRPFSRYSVSLENSDYIIRMEDSDRYSQETRLRHNSGNSDINENASGDTSEELQMFTCEVEKPCCSGDETNQSKKREREREHINEQNGSSNAFLHSDIEDLSSPLRKHCSSKLPTCDGENTEDVLHEVDPISCIMPIDPAQELYGHMMNQKDLIPEGSMSE